jgi:hypothetical protein
MHPLAIGRTKSARWTVAVGHFGWRNSTESQAGNN